MEEINPLELDKIEKLVDEKQEIYLGYNSISKLGEIVRREKFERILVVADKNSFEACGGKEIVSELLSTVEYELFTDFEINPQLEDARKGLEILKAKKYDCIIAIGGGTVIDMGKLINIFGAQEAINPLDIINREREISERGMGVIAIPTTGGTGSESTHFAVVYSSGTKYSIAHEYILPETVIIDPTFTLSTPQKVTASTGMDALAQGIESLWSINSTSQSKIYSAQCIKLALNNIIPAVKIGDKESKLYMAIAANLSGRAINITKTTGAHALSYYFTSKLGVPHGHAVALTLPQFVIFNGVEGAFNLNEGRGQVYLRAVMNELCELLGVADVWDAASLLRDICIQIGLEWRLHNIGFNVLTDIKKLLNSVNLDRLANNPVKVEKLDIPKILEMDIYAKPQSKL